MNLLIFKLFLYFLQFLLQIILKLFIITEEIVKLLCSLIFLYFSISYIDGRI